MTAFWKHTQPSRVERKLAQQRQDDANWRAVCKQVDARDHRICRCCGKRTNPDDIGLLRGHRHHIVYLSAGGEDTTENVLTLCPKCHDEEHVKRTLHVVGNADTGVEFWRVGEDGEWFLSKREIAVGRVEKD